MQHLPKNYIYCVNFRNIYSIIKFHCTFPTLTGVLIVLFSCKKEEDYILACSNQF